MPKCQIIKKKKKKCDIIKGLVRLRRPQEEAERDQAI